MRDFNELKVWQKAHRLVLDIYAQSRAFPNPAEPEPRLTADG